MEEPPPPPALAAPWRVKVKAEVPLGPFQLFRPPGSVLGLPHIPRSPGLAPAGRRFGRPYNNIVPCHRETATGRNPILRDAEPGVPVAPMWLGDAQGRAGSGPPNKGASPMLAPSVCGLVRVNH
ncbi:neurocalcin-delta [Platysternon megacephalum]|uniref:Neurocalcin-delta n=1 Tax=Platysternon megacephalum TaxID=55544 RepID=A0A4D9EQ80_9SAUR|nr:neurocalcin-delta [Platysternon megacephalum]